MSIIGNMLGIEKTQKKNVLLKNPWWYWQNTPPWISGLMDLGLMIECHKPVALWRHRASFHCHYEWRWHLLARMLTLRCYDTRIMLVPRKKVHSVSEWAPVCVYMHVWVCVSWFPAQVKKKTLAKMSLPWFDAILPPMFLLKVVYKIFVGYVNVS